jgi:hypothetical protein
MMRIAYCVSGGSGKRGHGKKGKVKESHDHASMERSTGYKNRDKEMRDRFLF